MAHNGYSLDSGFKGTLASRACVTAMSYDAGLPDDLLNRDEVRVSKEQYFASAEAMQDSVADPLFPLKVLERASAEWFSPPVLASLCSPNLETALERVARFKPLLAPVDPYRHRGATTATPFDTAAAARRSS